MKDKMFMGLMLGFILVISMASAETVKLDKNTCHYMPEINKDYCYAEYEVCDPLIDTNLITMKYADMKDSKDLIIVKDDLKINLPDLETETSIELSKASCYKVKVDGYKSPLIDVDHVLCYDDKCHTEYALWNGTYAYRNAIYGNVSGLVGNINGLIPKEMYLTGSKELFICNFTVSNTNQTLGYLYWNDYTDYVCVNKDETTASVTLIDEGNGTEYKTGLDTSLILLTTCNGTDIYDHSLYGNHGTVHSGVTSTIGKIGNAIHFDGTDDRINLTSLTSSNPKELTICGWFNNTGTSQTPISYHYNVGGYVDYWDLQFQASGPVEFRSKVSNAVKFDITTTESFTANKWFHLCVAYNSSETNGVHFYINGTETQGNTNNTWSSPAFSTIDYPIHVGETATGTGDYYGEMDMIMIFNRTLTKYDVLLLYGSQNALFNNGTTEINTSVIPITLPIEQRFCYNSDYLHVIDKDINASGNAVFNEYLIPCPYGCYDNVTMYGGACNLPPIYNVSIAFGMIIFFIVCIYKIPRLLKRKGRR